MPGFRLHRNVSLILSWQSCLEDRQGFFSLHVALSLSHYRIFKSRDKQDQTIWDNKYSYLLNENYAKITIQILG